MKIEFDWIKENCETIGDVQRIEKGVKELWHRENVKNVE